MNTRKIGTNKEQLAGKLLQLHGYEILEYNYRCRQGEIDIIARQGGYLVFVEVKFRGTDKKGCPEESVNEAKQRKISKVSRQYCCERRVSEDTPRRFDVVAIYEQTYKVIENAFEYK